MATMLYTPAELAQDRAEAESLMVDACALERPTGDEAQNPDTGTVEPVFDDLFSSACKVQERAVVALNSEVGSRTATTMRLELHLPASTGPLQTGDVAVITSVAGVSLVEVGDRLRISGPVGKTWATARRYEVTKVVA